jgi:pectinesterase
MSTARNYIPFYLLAMASLLALRATAHGEKSLPIKIIVDINGHGNFKSIQSALNSLTDSSNEPRTIFIRNGIYSEKIFITKRNIVLHGESETNTVITQDIARDEWRCDHPDDWGVATVNVNGSDITLINLTIENGYGLHTKASRTAFCQLDTVNHQKIIRTDGHQMALRTMLGTRLKAIHCRFIAFGGDTVSPWNVDNGMFYFRDCDMQGGVDFYCPRGWAWAENCHFYANIGPASIWHDGSKDPDSKSVFKNCFFDGYNGFKLGRYHRDAQFFLIDCKFSKAMADTDIYVVPTANVIQWGKRVYYYNCHRTGGDYAWHANNLPAGIREKDITILWLFGNKWNPGTQNE